MIPYATYEEIKDALPDTFGTTDQYKHAFRRCITQSSRLIDRLTGRTFWPQYATRYPHSDGGASLHVDGTLLEVDNVYMSYDHGENYTTLASTDYFAVGGSDLLYDATPIYRLDMNQNTTGNYGYWYTGQKSVKIDGWWGWHDNYANAWEDSQDTVENDPLTAAGTTVTVNSISGDDLWGVGPRFQVGQLIKADSEYMLVVKTTIAGGTETLTVKRAQCGTTAAAHDQDTTIYVYRPAEIVKEAVIASAVRSFKRAQGSYQDAGGVIELGQLMYVKEIAPEIKAVLYDAGLRRLAI